MQGVIRLHFEVLISESALAKHIDEKLNVTYKLIKVMKPGINSDTTNRQTYRDLRQHVQEFQKTTVSNLCCTLKSIGWHVSTKQILSINK